MFTPWKSPRRLNNRLLRLSWHPLCREAGSAGPSASVNWARGLGTGSRAPGPRLGDITGLVLSRSLVCERDPFWRWGVFSPQCGSRTPLLDRRGEAWSCEDTSRGPERIGGGGRWCRHVMKPTRLRETLRPGVPRAHVVWHPGLMAGGRPGRPVDRGCGHVGPDDLTSPLKEDHDHVDSSTQRRFVIQKRKQSLLRFIEIPVFSKK